uniref:Uncharacterized protein n=1 Tax=Anguilla anguilla TaxID=7936 RepID=A0A0E9QSW4_ANGAN
MQEQAKQEPKTADIFPAGEWGSLKGTIKKDNRIPLCSSISPE